ncbi:MAG: TIGR00730 family Rossman fold protein [Clostridia bacterium]|nr:TIGR00730 family Rossman fold protein [Clostridia bacterium]MBQ9761330.1 TIGR00730 family Rossman fold protein [Clostridia bacterium]
MNICVYGASSRAIDKKYTDAAHALGRALALRGHGLVFGGGNSGVMGATARGADTVEGNYILGIAPTFFNVDGVLYEGCSEFISPENMRVRKRLLEEHADAFVIAPGGIGTYDEFFEILTLKQLGRHNKPIAILDVDGYYEPLLALLRHTVAGEFMNETTMQLFAVFTDVEELLDYLENYDEPMHELSFFKKIGDSITEDE